MYVSRFAHLVLLQQFLLETAAVGRFVSWILWILFMAALCKTAGHYIFVLWFLSFFFFSLPNLSGHKLDVSHTSTHGVALVRI